MLIYGLMMLMQTDIRVPIFLHEVKTLVRQSVESIINAAYFYVKLISCGNPDVSGIYSVKRACWWVVHQPLSEDRDLIIVLFI